MNEELQRVLANLIEKTLEGTEAVIEFGQQEIPIVIEQLLMWHFVESLIWFSSSALLFIVSVVVLKKVTINTFTQGRDDEAIQEAIEAYERGELWTRHRSDPRTSTTSTRYDKIVTGEISEGEFAIGIVSGVISLILGLISIISIVDNITWIKIWLAPKLYLLEYGASLVK